MIIDMEEFSSEGSEFYLAFFNNQPVVELFAQTKVIVRANNLEQVAQNVVLSYESRVEQVQIGPGDFRDFNLPIDIRLQDNAYSMDKGVSIKTTNGGKLSVTALGDELSSSDTYQVLPVVYLPTEYEYYTVSVPAVNKLKTTRQ